MGSGQTVGVDLFETEKRVLGERRPFHYSIERLGEPRIALALTVDVRDIESERLGDVGKQPRRCLGIKSGGDRIFEFVSDLRTDEAATVERVRRELDRADRASDRRAATVGD